MHDQIRRIVLYSLSPVARLLARHSVWPGVWPCAWPCLWPCLWMTVIFYFSTDRFSSVETSSRFEVLVNWVAPWMEESSRVLLHLLWRKLGHVTEYAILAILWLRAFEKSGGNVRQWPLRRRVAITLLLVAAYALFDEWHQSLTATRTASLRDSLLDVCGGVLGIALWNGRRWLKGFRN